MASSNIRVQRVRVRLPQGDENTAWDLANDLRGAIPGALARKQAGARRSRSIATVNAGGIRGAEAGRVGTRVAEAVADAVVESAK
jgi:uncharacterized protein YcfJ